MSDIFTQPEAVAMVPKEPIFLRGSPFQALMEESLNQKLEIARLTRELADRDRQAEKLSSLFEQIVGWCRAYPLEVFPEPDFAKAREALAVANITIDAVSASNMRHVTKGIEDLISAEMNKWGADR